MEFPLFLFMIFLLYALLPEAWGRIYHHTGKNGNVVFSDKPPSGKESWE